MKKPLLTLLTFASCALFADESQIWYQEDNPTPPPVYPFSLNGEYYAVDDASFRTNGFDGQHLQFKQGDAAFTFTLPCNEIWGLIFGAGYITNEVKWAENPEFNETWFNYVNVSVGAFTTSFKDWLWTATVAANIDTQKFDLGEYALYQGIVWGKYQWCPRFDFNIGFILELGLNKDKIWPIAGFNWDIWECLHLHAVYPINLSLDYDIFSWLQAAGSIRFLRTRHRVDTDEPNPQGIFEYMTKGIEFDLIVRPCTWIEAKGFVGTTFNGDLKVTDRNDNHGIHYKFKGSGYAGVYAQIAW